jgi:hypothetical protein
MWKAIAAVLLPAACLAQPETTDPAAQVAELRAMVMKLQARVDELESRAVLKPASAAAPLVAPTPVAATPGPALPTVNVLVDGYYGYNFNRPIGRVNLLRAYDVSSNAFALNQAALVLEQAPDPANGRRWGTRLDLQFGQATAATQGNPANEPRPEIYRAIFQAYGTYVAPVAHGLTVDFGKWASSLGIEGNYTKDQINYSRSYWFDYLPFYHMGVRASLKLTDRFSVNYWVTNGINQTEPFKAYKDQMFGFAVQPAKTVNWTVNYYLGEEHPGFADAPRGKTHIFDTYGTWAVTPRLTIAAEADWVISRLETISAPSHVAGGAGYFQYGLTRHFTIGARAEYLSDRGGLFSGTTQALKEGTVTLDYKIGDGFLMRGEWRRDFSNGLYFPTDTPGVLRNYQNTATIGLIWWAGAKQGAW